MRKYLLTIICGLVALTANATDAKSVLDKTAAEYKKCPSVTVQFEIMMGGDKDKGTILLQGSKFKTTLTNHITWFDGKTMWSYVKENEEVNVTTPTAAQLAKINPYAFLDIYKKGYDVEFGASTKTYYEIVLTANNSKSSIKKAIVRINKFDHHPEYIMMGGKKGDMEISVISFKKGKKQPDSVFRFNKKKYPKAEVIDLR